MPSTEAAPAIGSAYMDVLFDIPSSGVEHGSSAFLGDAELRSHRRPTAHIESFV